MRSPVAAREQLPGPGWSGSHVTPLVVGAVTKSSWGLLMFRESTATALRPAVVGLAVALLLAACAGGASDTAEPATSTPSPAPPASEAATESAAGTTAEAEVSVLVAESDLGQILTDADGNTIYYFANDSEGTSSCAGDCLANWPPVPAEGTPSPGAGVTAELGTATATDGTTMLTVNGFPAYYFAGDQAPGDTNGQGVGDVWYVFGPDGEPVEG